MMRVIDLTQIIEKGMPVFPGTAAPVMRPANSYEHDGFKETHIGISSHTGTHIDPPAHIWPGRTPLDDFPPEQFIGTAVVIDCRDIPDGGAITADRLAGYGDLIKKAEFLLFNTGRDKLWGTEAYFGEYPCVDDEVLDMIISGGFKGIGFDVIGLDPVCDEDLPRHKKLFKDTDIINIENLKDLDKCGSGLIKFICLPIKLRNSDGAPARAVAVIE